jgi:hypothetical protein
MIVRDNPEWTFMTHPQMKRLTEQAEIKSAVGNTFYRTESETIIINEMDIVHTKYGKTDRYINAYEAVLAIYGIL